jgi:hypothetical protein
LSFPPLPAMVSVVAVVRLQAIGESAIVARALRKGRRGEGIEPSDWSASKAGSLRPFAARARIRPGRAPVARAAVRGGGRLPVCARAEADAGSKRRILRLLHLSAVWRRPLPYRLSAGAMAEGNGDAARATCGADAVGIAPAGRPSRSQAPTDATVPAVGLVRRGLRRTRRSPP